MAKFFGHPGRQVFGDNIAEDIFALAGGDGNVPRATGTASPGTDGRQIFTPVGENRKDFMQSEGFHGWLFSCSLENEKGQSSISRKFAKKNQKGKAAKTDFKEAGQEAERIADHRQPTDQERPDAIPLVQFFRTDELLVADAKNGADKKVRTPPTDQIGRARSEKVADTGDHHDVWWGKTLDDEKNEEPLRAKRQDRRRKKAEQKKSGQPGGVEERVKEVHGYKNLFEKNGFGNCQGMAELPGKKLPASPRYLTGKIPPVLLKRRFTKDSGNSKRTEGLLPVAGNET
jgi:hypothetical protein